MFYAVMFLPEIQWGDLSRVVPIVLVIAAAPPGCRDAKHLQTGDAQHDHIRVRLLCDRPVLTAAEVCTVGVHFEIEEGWHLYGNGRSDSGLPISVVFEPPPGFRLDPLIWPAPARLVSAGQILDQVYEESVTLRAPMHVPGELDDVDAVRLSCRLEWLVCGTGCIPGADTLELTLPVGAGPAQARSDAVVSLFRKAQDRTPRPWPDDDERFRVVSDGDRWILQVAGARGLTFFPAADCALLLDPIASTVSDFDRLVLRKAPGATEESPLTGLIAVDEGRNSVFYRVTATTGDPNDGKTESE